MQSRDWTVCIIEPNKLDAQIIVDILRGVGATRVKIFADGAAAMAVVDLFAPNIIIAAYDCAPLNGVAWTKAFRRNLKALNRKAAIFITARALSKAVAEECRHGGANAIVIKPLSSQSLIATIKKVLNNPRTFIDAPGYVGPCRRAGIVTADAPKRRRKSDASKQAGQGVAPIGEAVERLKRAVHAFTAKSGDAAACVQALNAVQAAAALAGDGPLMRACAAFSLQLSTQDEAATDVLAICMTGVNALADPGNSDAAQREAFAEQVRQAVAKAALRAA